MGVVDVDVYEVEDKTKAHGETRKGEATHKYIFVQYNFNI